MDAERYIGVFEDEQLFDKAVQALKESNIDIEELYMPLPVHHAVRSVAGSSRLPAFAYFIGIFAAVSILSFLYYAAVISWPLNFGGKPSNAFPSFIIVTLIFTILAVTVLSLLAFSISAKLYPGKKAEILHERAMTDKFIIVLKSDQVPNGINILKQNGADEVITSPQASSEIKGKSVEDYVDA